MDDFKPIPYTFNLTDVFDKPLRLDKHARDKVIAHCPPFHILLDHTIAVLWQLFFVKEKACPLRSAQISWALRFLEGMTNDSRKGAYSVDIEKAIDCLRDALVNFISKETTQVAEDSYSVPASSHPDADGNMGEHEEGEGDKEQLERPTRIAAYLDEERNHVKSILLRDMLKTSMAILT